jgi:hypothetical protein
VLGSDEAYREWGYTALSRHRDSAHFYVTAPAPFLNRKAPDVSKLDDLLEVIERTLDDSHHKELALEAIERDPRAIRALHELDEAQERQRVQKKRLDALCDQRRGTPWYQRGECHGLDRAIAAKEHVMSNWGDHVVELREELDRRISRKREPGPPQPARDLLADTPWLGPATDLADMDRDLGL